MYSPTNEFSLRNDGGSKLVKTAARQWALYCSLCSAHLAVKLYDVRREKKREFRYISQCSI